jgi:hypothetical protein
VSPVLVLSVSDGVYGRPAAGIPARLECTTPAGDSVRLYGETDDRGRWTPGVVGAGWCSLTVDPACYYAALGMSVLVAELVVAVRLRRDAGPQRVSLTVAPSGHAVYVGL